METIKLQKEFTQERKQALETLIKDIVYNWTVEEVKYFMSKLQSENFRAFYKASQTIDKENVFQNYFKNDNGDIGQYNLRFVAWDKELRLVDKAQE